MYYYILKHTSKTNKLLINIVCCLYLKSGHVQVVTPNSQFQFYYAMCIFPAFCFWQGLRHTAISLCLMISHTLSRSQILFCAWRSQVLSATIHTYVCMYVCMWVTACTVGETTTQNTYKEKNKNKPGATACSRFYIDKRWRWWIHTSLFWIIMTILAVFGGTRPTFMSCESSMPQTNFDSRQRRGKTLLHLYWLRLHTHTHTLEHTLV